MLTKISDQDVDRAAVGKTSLGSAINPDVLASETLSVEKLQSVLSAYLVGNGPDRIDAMWDLVDRDQDGLIDEVEVNGVCRLAMMPVAKALEDLLKEALDASAATAPLPDLRVKVDGKRYEHKDTRTQQPKGWRQKRRETNAKKRLLKMFRATLKNYFDDELEMPHRLRCIYAWANKKHQDNKVDSVLVDADSGGGSWSGKQRHVELHPKITLNEF